MVHHGQALFWTVDSHPYAKIIRAMELLSDRFQTVVAVFATTFPQTDGAERQIKLVVDYHDALRRYLVASCQRGYGPPRLIHESGGAGEDHATRLVPLRLPGVSRDSTEFVSSHGRSAISELLENEESHIVAGALVARAGVS